MVMNKTQNTSGLLYGSISSAALLVLLLATAGCSKSKVQAAPAMPAPLVTVVSATAQDVPKYLDEIGRNAAFGDGRQLTVGQIGIRHEYIVPQ